MNDRVALWPELTIARHVSTSYNGVSSDVNAVGVAARALVYTSRIDAFRTYVAPEFTYGRQHSTGSASVLGATAPGPESTSSSYGVTGSYGAQYVLGSHFGVFGEFGVEYTRQTVTTNIASQTVSKTRGNTIGTASRVGVIVYF